MSSEPVVTRRGNSVIFEWPPSPLKVILNRFHDSSQKTEAEITVKAITPDTSHLITTAKINLQSISTRKKLAQDLTERYQADWISKIEQVCVLGLRVHREGEPFQALEPTVATHAPFLINPILYKDHQTLWYAPGGSCKSYLALYLALLAAHGSNGSGVAALQVPPLYLDWELNKETVGGRLTAIQAGHPELSQFVPYYRHCELPLYQEADLIAEYVGTHGIELVIIDSVALACGGDLASPESAIKLQRAIRTIGCSSLVLAHVAKQSAEGQVATAYGSVFFRELARNVWEAQRAEGANPVRVALHHRKNNFGPLKPALGFELSFENDSVHIQACDPELEPEFLEKLPIAARIRNLLEDGELRTSQEIADALEANLRTVKNSLSQGEGQKWHKIGDNKFTQWTVLKPRLRSTILRYSECLILVQKAIDISTVPTTVPTVPMRRLMTWNALKCLANRPYRYTVTTVPIVPIQRPATKKVPPAPPQRKKKLRELRKEEESCQTWIPSNT